MAQTFNNAIVRRNVNAIRLKSVGGAALILALSKLVRIERPTFKKFTKACEDGRPVVLIAWHGSMLVPIYCFRRRNLVNMTSMSEDGDMVTNILYALGYECVRGSSSRGGMRVLLEMIRILKGGRNGAITVDGPRGPRHEVKPGVVLLAQKTGALLVPVGMGFSNSISFDNWDHTEIPLPGSRAVMITGDPFTIDPGIGLQHGCKLVRDSIFACEAVAREYLATGRLNSCIIEKTGGIN
ncbi:MAG: lysophospholipid acyltransferase family protein [Candidatus Riflebacteria bacterium]|nr:lysophospholipid acyltransferase family protein [Candidatus Riflebacteria bacterium]